MPRVVLDVQALQSAGYRERGVARYTAEFAAALIERHPDYVDSLALNPSLPLPTGAEELLSSGRLRPPSEYASIYHALSPVELSVPAADIWPRYVSRRRMHLVVTVYDVIPGLFPDVYLQDPTVRQRYRGRLELIRAADHVMAISESAAHDVREVLGLREDRVSVVGAAPSAMFEPPLSRAEAVAEARRAVPGLEDRYVIYTGGVEPRKNLERLVDSYARLPADVRAHWQLVIVCAMNELQSNHYRVKAARLGISDRLLLTGFVPDGALVRLYQATDLMVFPSLYEGYGLPVADALSCGAAVIASDTSSLVELVEPDARFDPRNVESISEKMRQALTDDAFRDSLLRHARRPLPTWSEVADKAVAVYDRLQARPRPRWRRRQRIAVVTPWPPAASGVARYSDRLVAAMRALGRADVDVFVDDPSCHRLDDVDLPPARALPSIEPIEGGYDRVLYCIGNSEFHAGALRLLRVDGRRGVVLAHDVRLTGLYLHGEPRGAVPEGFAAALHSIYPELPAGAAHDGILMVRELLARSTGFVTTSEHAAVLARADGRPEDAGKVSVVPHAFAPVTAHRGEPETGLIASFGVVNEIKRTTDLVSAFAKLAQRQDGARLVFVGPASAEDRNRILALAESRGVAQRVQLTGAVPDDEYESWFVRASIGVQLRASSNGESSGAVADCLAHGVPTVVSAIGSALELPEDAVAFVPAAASADEIADTLETLLDDPERLRRLSERAQAHAASYGYGEAAERLLDILLASPDQ